MQTLNTKSKKLKIWQWIISIIVAGYYMVSSSVNSKIGLSMLSTPGTEFGDFFSYTLRNFGMRFLIVMIVFIFAFRIINGRKA